MAAFFRAQAVGYLCTNITLIADVARGRQLVSGGVQKSSTKVYRAAWNKFCDFRASRVIRDLPISEEVILAFIAHLFHDCRFKASSVVSYLAGVRSVALEHGMQLDIYSPAVRRAVRAVRLNSDPPKSKLPITTDILRRMYNCFHIADPLERAYWTCCVVLFFGLFRAGELLPADHEYAVRWSDIDFARHESMGYYASIRLRKSKTDPFRQGVNVYLPCVQDVTCPVCHLWILASCQMLEALTKCSPSTAIPSPKLVSSRA
jgi:hypothetical protein